MSSPPADAAVPAPERVEAPRCLDPATRWVASLGGAGSEEACPAATVCLDGACVEAPSLDGAPLDVGRLRAVSDEGWLDAWSAHLGLGQKAASRFFEEGHVDGLGNARALCSPSGWIGPRRPADTKTAGTAVLRGILVSAADRELELRASVRGKLAVAWGSERFEIDELSGLEGRPWPDERFVRVRVPRGATRVAVALEPETGLFALRLREPDGRPARGLAFAEESAACEAGALLDPGADLELGPSGLALVLAPRFRGLVPRLDEAPTFVASVAGKDRRVAGEASFARKDLAGGGAPAARIAVVPPAEGGFQVSAALGERVVFARDVAVDAALVARIAAAKSAAEAAARDPALPDGTKASLEHHASVVASAAAGGDRDRAWIDRHTARLEKLLAKASRGTDPYAGARGVAFRAYRSPLDGRLQPYVAFVPPRHDPAKKLPLVVVAHGRDRLPEHALRTLVGEAPDEDMTLAWAARNLPPMPDLGTILVAPWAHGNAGVQGVGERDVLAVIDEMVRAYPVDQRKVTMTGYSLGGTMSFVVPLHHPDRFGAAAPLCGYPNLLGYRSVHGVPHLPYEDALLAKEYVVRYAENGLHLPLHIVHGGKDVPGRSKVVADRYKELGYERRFDLQEDLDHNVWDHAYKDGRMIAWLRGHAVPEAPSHVRLVTGKYRYDRAFWVRLVQMTDSSSAEPASIDARFDAAEARVTARTSNVSAFALTPARMAADPPATIRVAVDGGAEIEVAARGEIVLVRSGDGSFRPGAPPEGAKRHGLSGPMDDVQHGPVAIVYGTADPALVEANRMVAEHLATLGGSADVRYPVLSDAEATDAALGGKNVVLVGGPSQNRLTAAIAEGLPVRFEERAVVLRGRRHEGDDVAVSFIHPGPEAFAGDGAKKRSAERYVVLHAGLSARAILAARNLPRYLPDFVVYDASLAVQRGGLLMDRRPIRDAGFFSETWQ